VKDAADDPTRAAIAAALAVASEQGLTVTEPRIVGNGSNRIVWLRPAPIVARVMTGTVVLHRDPRAWLQRELDVGSFLAREGAPIVPPATEVDPGPHLTGGLWLSLWLHVEVAAAGLSAGEIGRSLRSLHDALARYRGPLPPRAAVLEEIDWLLAALGDRDGAPELQEERDRLAPLLDGADGDGQPLHGDASMSNLLSTTGGPRWNDFEDVCFGPPAWDVVGVVEDARERKGDAFAAEVLAAYGRAVDPALARVVQDVQHLYWTLWQRYTTAAPRPG
jgi:Phosphotransferase enzyme family